MDWRQEEALWRYSLIREAADARLSCGERGALVRLLAARLHAHPSGELRSVGRSTLDDWIRAYRAGGFAALAPRQRASVPRTARALLEQAETLRRENPARTCAQIQRIITAANGGSGPSQSTIERHLRRVGLTRAGVRGERQAFGRFEASVPNERWIADCLHGPMVEGRRAILFTVLDDHSRLVVGAQFAHAESTVRLEGVLRCAFQARGLCQRLYVDNGAPYASRQLARVCAALGIRLTHSTPGRPQRAREDRAVLPHAPPRAARRTRRSPAAGADRALSGSCRRGSKRHRDNPSSSLTRPSVWCCSVSLCGCCARTTTSPSPGRGSLCGQLMAAITAFVGLLSRDRTPDRMGPGYRPTAVPRTPRGRFL